MKKLLTIVLLLSSIFCIAQNCKVKKDVDEMKGVIRYIPLDRYSITLMKNVSIENKLDTINYAILVIHSASSDYHAKGYLIKFEDGSILKDINQDIDCSYEGSYDYRMTAFFRADKELINALTTKKVVKVQLDIYASEIKDKEANKIQDQVKCMIDYW